MAGRAGPVHGADGGGGVPGLAVRARGRAAGPRRGGRRRRGGAAARGPARGAAAAATVPSGSRQRPRRGGRRAARPARCGRVRSRPSRWPARTGRRPSSAAGRSRAVRVSSSAASASESPSRLLGVGCSGWPSRSDCSAVRKRSGLGGRLRARRGGRRGSRRCAARSRRPGRPGRLPSVRPASRPSSAATVTASTAGRVARARPPGRAGRSGASRWRTSSGRGRAGRCRWRAAGCAGCRPSGRARSFSRTQQRSRFSTAAASAARQRIGVVERVGVCRSARGRAERGWRGAAVRP